MSDTVASRLAEFAVAQRRAGLSGDIEHAATRAILDWYGATIVGATMPPAKILHSVFATGGEAGPCSLVGLGGSASPRDAALINATASHTAELDDIFRDGVYHPGSPTVAAALAAAEAEDANGRDLLRSVAVGYEVGDRIAAAVQPAHYTYWHTTGTVGTIGAAAAGAELLRLDAAEFAHAIATAVTMAAGLQQAFRSDAMSKPLHAGHAAEAGLLAAFAARAGFTGALDILEGPAGFGAGMSDEPDWDAALDRLGSPWGITQATVKNHSCCGHTFAAIDAALALRSELPPTPDIAEIHIETYATAIKVAGNADPQTAFEAKFSLAYCVAAALKLGSVRLKAFSDDQLRDQWIRDLVGKTTLTVDPAFDSVFPGQRCAKVRVVVQGGQEFGHDRKTRKGDPDDPLDDDELGQKFSELAESVLGPARSDELQALLWNVAELDSVRALAKAFA